MKPFDQLTFSDNYMFYAVLRSRPDLCKRIIELITGRKVASIQALRAEHEIKHTYRSKGVRFDVVFTDDLHNGYDLEMQIGTTGDLLKRSRYYSSLLDLELLKRGEDYHNLRESFIIFICQSDPFHLGLPRYDFETSCLQNRALTGDGAHRVFLNAAAFAEDEDPAMQAFLRYVNSGFAEDDLTADIESALDSVRLDEVLRGDYMTFQEMVDMEREEARIEGHAEGRAEGRAEGFEEGRSEGIQQTLKQLAAALNYSEEELAGLLVARATPSSESM